VLQDSANLTFNGNDLTVNSLTVGTGGGNVAGNSAFGVTALSSNTTSTGNTALGYQAGKVATGGYNVYVGHQSGLSATTGVQNTMIGQGAGYAITTGTKSVVLGSYSGNQGGLDIRTATNYVVLSDGDGNPQVSAANGKSVALAGAVPVTGTGISFPATQSASTDVNTLDDYEEGTFTPALSPASGTITFSSVSGSYTKVGRQVFVRAAMVTATSSSASGLLSITGLPFPVSGSGAGSCTVYNWNAGSYFITVEPNTSSSSAYVFSFNNGARTDASSLVGSGNFYFSIVYNT
jgi:hypothetical protein